MKKYILPAIMICLNLGQGIMMIKSGKVINGIYWFAAATLNATVAMMGE